VTVFSSNCFQDSEANTSIDLNVRPKRALQYRTLLTFGSIQIIWSLPHLLQYIAFLCRNILSPQTQPSSPKHIIDQTARKAEEKMVKSYYAANNIKGWHEDFFGNSKTPRALRAYLCNAATQMGGRIPGRFRMLM